LQVHILSVKYSNYFDKARVDTFWVKRSLAQTTFHKFGSSNHQNK